jgi:hypothetical protein
MAKSVLEIDVFDYGPRPRRAASGELGRAHQSGGRRNGRVDLDEQQVERLGVVDQREQGRVAGVAAVPERFAVDFHRLEEVR